MVRSRAFVLSLLIALFAAMPGRAAAVDGVWSWPVVGPVIRAFDAPDTPYGSGHRGIDIAVAVGTPVLAPASGVVTFAGPVGGQLYVSVDHGNGLTSTCSFLSAVLVRKGDLVAEGSIVAMSGAGHVGAIVPHMHFGVRSNGTYIDPMSVLAAPDLSGVVRLAPMLEPGVGAV